MTMVRVSVILCCYNDADYVADALKSVCQQTLPRDQYEVILVDDGSTDATERVTRGFSGECNFRYIKHGENLGLPQACNRGLAEARGDYVIRLDADDSFNQTILEEMVRPLGRGLTDLVYCDRREWLADKGEMRIVRIEALNVFDLIAIGTMMRRQLVLDIGGYRNLFWEEYDLYIRYLSRSTRVPYHIDQPLLLHTIREGSMTSNLDRVGEGWEELQRLWPPATLARFGRLPSIARGSTAETA